MTKNEINLLNKIPQWLINIFLLIIIILLCYAVFDGRKVEFWPPTIHEKQIESQNSKNQQYAKANCYLSLQETGNIDMFCIEKTNVYGTFIYPNQRTKSPPTKCVYNGKIASNSNKTIDIKFNNGQCENGRGLASSFITCITSTFNEKLTCRFINNGKLTNGVVIYEQLKIN